MLGVIIGYEDSLNELADMRMKVKIGKFGGKKHLPCEPASCVMEEWAGSE